MGGLLVPIFPVANVLEGGFGMRKSEGPCDSAVRNDPAAPETRRTTRTGPHRAEVGNNNIIIRLGYTDPMT